MKKGVILFITLFFLLSLAILIQYNLNSANKLITLKYQDKYMLQAFESIDNLDTILKNIFKKYELYKNLNTNRAKVEKILNKPFVLKYQNIDITFKIDTLNKRCDINTLLKNKPSKSCKEILNFYEIDPNIDIYSNISYKLQEKIKQNNYKISNYKKKNSIIDELITNLYLEVDKKKFKDSFTIASDTNSSTNILCEYELSIDNESFCSVRSIYNLSSKKVELAYFEYFK
jgi:hypothetical protein